RLSSFRSSSLFSLSSLSLSCASPPPPRCSVAPRTRPLVPTSPTLLLAIVVSLLQAEAALLLLSGCMRCVRCAWYVRCRSLAKETSRVAWDAYLLLDRFDDLLHAGHDEPNSSSIPLLAILREGQLEVDQEQSI